MKKNIMLLSLLAALQLHLFAQKATYNIPQMPNPTERKATKEHDWAALQKSPLSCIVV